MNVDSLTLCIIICGYGLWFSLAVFNNITDFQTNRFLIGKMIGMEEIKDDPNLGNQIQWRALHGKHWATIIFSGVVLYQVLAAFKLILVGIALVEITMTGNTLSNEILQQVNIALLMMLILWFGFLTGGLWFGYWMKMPQVQVVHILLVLITIMCLILTKQF